MSSQAATLIPTFFSNKNCLVNKNNNYYELSSGFVVEHTMLIISFENLFSLLPV